MKTGRLIRIGLLFAISIFVLVWGINFLKGKNFLKPEKVFFAKYERIGSLMVSSPVMVKGFKVGEVRDISLGEDFESPVLVKFAITYEALELPIGTEVKIISTDLMGTKGIELIMVEDTVLIPYGDTLIGIIEGDLKDQVNTQMLPLKRKAEDLMASMDSVLVSLHLVFDQQNRSNLSQSFEIVTQTLKNVEQTSVFLENYVKSESGKLSYVLSNLDSLTQNLVNRTAELQLSILNIGSFTDSLNKVPLRIAVEQFVDVLQDVNQIIQMTNAGEGSLGKLLQSDSLYYTIENVSRSLNDLLLDIKLNPKRYIRVSAIDRGKTIITTDNQEFLSSVASDIDLEYYVCIYNNLVPLLPDHELYKTYKKLSFIQVGKHFYYYPIVTRNFDKARRSFSKLVSTYPDVAIYAWIDGKWQNISL